MKYTGEGRYIRRTGGAGSHGHVVLNISSGDRNSGLNYVNNVTNGDIPKEYFKSIELGVKEALQEGYLAGYPITDVNVEIVSGSYHDVDSKADDYKIAAKMAIKDACSRAPMSLLEPIALVEIDTPNEYIGAILSDITKRRGKITEANDITLTAEVPVSEMFGYSTDLRSLTQGRATFVLTPMKYDEVPKHIEISLVK